MSEIKDGGPAFPGPDQAEQSVDINEGMTLRDYFAAKAMQAHLITHADQNTRNIVEWSYQVADEMIACRTRGAV
jgi:hypothetical protein